MAEPGQVLENPATGERFVFVKTAKETGGELVAFDAIGPPSGFGTQRHVHPHHEERYEVISGAIGLDVAGRKQVLRAGDTGLVPPGTPHRVFAVEAGEPRVRFELRPAHRIEAFLERYVELGRTGQFTKRGYPRLLPGAAMAREFEHEGYATRPPLAVQRAVLGPLVWLHRRIQAMPAEYAFLDEWTVDAPIDAVFDAIADARTYSDWWRPVYIAAEADGPPALGRVSRQHFKGRLPYHLHTTSEIVRLEPPRLVEARVQGDLAGRGIWTLTPRETGTHVSFDWRVNADRPLLRVLTPLLRPLFRWNHNWAIARAMEGLEPYARRRAAETAPAAENAPAVQSPAS